MIDANARLNSDEAVDGLVLRHLIERRELTLFNWDASYYGVTEGLLTLPFALAIGCTPVALKLGALAGCGLYSIAIYHLARLHYGPSAGLLAAALSVAIAPTVLDLSMNAAGGYFLVIALGTTTLALLVRLPARPSRRALLGLGALAGFGLYTYQLYLPYLLLLLAWSATGVRTLKTEPRQTIERWLSLLVGIGLGWAPYLHHLVSVGRGGKQPSYAVADRARALANWHLLQGDCLPHLLGLRTAPDSPIFTAVFLGCWLTAAVGGAAWLWALPRRRSGRKLGTDWLLVSLVPLTAALFLASKNPTDFTSLRYLLPWLTSFPVLASGMLTSLAKGRWRWSSLTLATTVVAFPILRLLTAVPPYFTAAGAITSDPLRAAVRFAESRGLLGGYAPYWIAYKVDYLTGERFILAPYQGWDRYPPYRERVNDLSEVAVFVRATYWDSFPGDAEMLRHRDDIRNQLETGGKPFAVRRFDPYEVYYSPAHERLLGPELVTPVALTRPAAEIEATVPAQAAPAARLTIPARVVNRSDGGWSATGLPFRAGALRVAFAYRWLRPDGSAAVVEGERSLLPADVEPGGSVRLTPHVSTPATPGRYQLVLTLVQEEVVWFDQASGSAARAWVDVQPSAPGDGRPRG